MCWNNSSIVYGEIYKIFVKDSLDAANRKDKSFSQDAVGAEYVSYWNAAEINKLKK